MWALGEASRGARRMEALARGAVMTVKPPSRYSPSLLLPLLPRSLLLPLTPPPPPLTPPAPSHRPRFAICRLMRETVMPAPGRYWNRCSELLRWVGIQPFIDNNMGLYVMGYMDRDALTDSRAAIRSDCVYILIMCVCEWVSEWVCLYTCLSECGCVYVCAC